MLDEEVTLQRQTSTVYSLLNQISRQTGCFFVYDSELIDNHRRVSIRRNRKDIRTFLQEILNDESLSFLTIQNHILIYRPLPEGESPLANVDKPAVPSSFTVRGRVLDQVSGAPMPYASVGIPERGMGISTNQDGFFQLRLPLSLIEENLQVSYLGYKSQKLPLRLLDGNQVDIMMETDYISMQEVIIRYYDPKTIIREALERREENYSPEPVYLLSFYREGVQRNNKFLNYSEAVFRMYKSPYNAPLVSDQVMLLKARNITNIDRSDTLVLKLKAGVQSVIELDIMKNLPDFLDPEFIDEYEFTNADLLFRNGRGVFAVEFRQKENVRGPLFMGIIYIDQEHMAVIEADFEINPRYLNQAQHRFVTKRNPNYVSNIEQASYTINYQYYNGRYHLNHLRGELKLKFRRKGQLFSNNYSAFIEMAVGLIEEGNVSRFGRREVLQPNIIFTDQGYQYDETFWGEYNIITPEASINEALSRISSRIESFVAED
ncbi:MAG: carboxypeptidase-like regulatory domain-containing protein [Bacteroidales bacterium]|nr:carboxypeptidase-like regulatory domain-containing protein [Bacteroidales bacterium]